jgi:hypothetical protein
MAKVRYSRSTAASRQAEIHPQQKFELTHRQISIFRGVVPYVGKGGERRSEPGIFPYLPTGDEALPIAVVENLTSFAGRHLASLTGTDGRKPKPAQPRGRLFSPGRHAAIPRETK